MSGLKPSRELLTFRDHARTLALMERATSDETALWTQLADEIDQFIAARNDDGQGVLI